MARSIPSVTIPSPPLPPFSYSIFLKNRYAFVSIIQTDLGPSLKITCSETYFKINSDRGKEGKEQNSESLEPETLASFQSNHYRYT